MINQFKYAYFDGAKVLLFEHPCIIFWRFICFCLKIIACREAIENLRNPLWLLITTIFNFCILAHVFLFLTLKIESPHDRMVQLVMLCRKNHYAHEQMFIGADIIMLDCGVRIYRRFSVRFALCAKRITTCARRLTISFQRVTTFFYAMERTF